MTDKQSKVPAWAKREPLSKAQVVEKLKQLAEASYAVAAATTGDADVRAGTMDRAHTLREALRYLR